jgi:thiamine pyrophosphokinase
MTEVPGEIGRITAADLVIAADGGAAHCQLLGITPDVVIGDLDSIEEKLLKSYRKQKVVIERHPAEKDATDLELALDKAVKSGASQLDIFGALGGRWDMSLANILLMASARYRDIDITLYDHQCSMRILHPGKNRVFGKKGQALSLLPLTGEVLGVNLSGLEYPLCGKSISIGSSLGVSNVFASSQAVIEHGQGILLCISGSTDLL